jgi:hypothetical protein
MDEDDDEPFERRSRGPLGSPESAAYFLAALEELGETKASFARLLKRKGDDRQPDTIIHNLRRMAAGDARVSGEMRVILTMMLRAKRRGELRTNEAKAKRVPTASPMSAAPPVATSPLPPTPP